MEVAPQYTVKVWIGLYWNIPRKLDFQDQFSLVKIKAEFV